MKTAIKSLVLINVLLIIMAAFVHGDRIEIVRFRLEEMGWGGNVRVLNRSEGIIPLMLDVTYLFSFDFIRAAQSMVNTVLCTPGALSAYRTEVVMRILPKWINQRFCGRPANIGEDRAMTNLILREGYSTLFQQNALVYTSVPVRYKNLCRMFLRWARSNVRETLVMSTFAFRTFREGPMLGARINLLLQWMTLTASQLLFLGTLASLFLYPTLIVIPVLFGIVISSSLRAWLYCWRKRNTEGIWAYLYGIFWFLALSWITPYAIFTLYKTGWLTRQTRDLKPRIPRIDTGLLPVS